MSDRRRTVLSFVLGVLFGGLLMGAGSHFYFTRCGKPFPPGERGERMKKEFLGDMRRNLNLTPDQDQKIEKILESKKKEIEILREKIRPDFHRLREESHNLIRAVLNAEQTASFNTMLEERKKRFEKNFPPEAK